MPKETAALVKPLADGPTTAVESHAQVLKPAESSKFSVCSAGGLAVLAILGCSPALDWRLVRPADWSLSLSMPCRPAQQERTLRLADLTVQMRMVACQQGEHVLAVTSADVQDPARVGAALAAMTAAAQANVRGKLVDDGPALVPGMTPHASARRWHVLGQDRAGAAVCLQGQVFAHGTRVFQVSVVGPSEAEALLRPLLESLEVRQ